jgi:formylglycine-generating enzyme required for sulfatase activity
MEDRMRIFISYAREDQDKAHQIYRRLLDAGCNPWIDIENLLPGEKFKNVIEQTLTNCDMVIVCLSTASVRKRSFFQREVKQALDRLQEMLADDVFVVPVRFDNCGIPSDLAQYHCEDLFGQREDRGWQHLLEAIERQAKNLSKPIVKPAGRSIPQPTISAPVNHVLEQSQSFSEDLGNGVKLEMIYLPGGTFWMGSPDGVGEINEHPKHRVTLSPFYIGKYTVTRGQWKAVVDKVPTYFDGDDLPVERESWDGAVKFCKMISKQTGRTYRLPTEAEWEYACRAGATGLYCFGDDGRTLEQYAWYQGNYDGKSHPVGQKKPNQFGLYDMHGNVWEWCQDWYDANYYTQSPETDPQGPVKGVGMKVIRGGSSSYSSVHCRSASRGCSDNRPIVYYVIIGFRVVCEVKTR